MAPGVSVICWLPAASAAVAVAVPKPSCSVTRVPGLASTTCGAESDVTCAPSLLMNAFAPADTLLLAIMKPTPAPVAPIRADALEVAALLRVAFSAASLSASTVAFPPTWSFELTTEATASAGCSPPSAPEISGSPRMASMVLNRTFDAFQPSALKARVIPTEVSVLVTELSTVASMPEVFLALTSRSPVVVTSLATMAAFASARTTLVAIWPPPAQTVPLPSMLPPDAFTVIRPSALSSALSRAVTETDAASTSALTRRASTLERRSFMTIRTPTARASESRKLPMPG